MTYYGTLSSALALIANWHPPRARKLLFDQVRSNLDASLSCLPGRSCCPGKRSLRMRRKEEEAGQAIEQCSQCEEESPTVR